MICMEDQFSSYYYWHCAPEVFSSTHCYRNSGSDMVGDAVGQYLFRGQIVYLARAPKGRNTGGELYSHPGDSEFPVSFPSSVS